MGELEWLRQLKWKVRKWYGSLPVWVYFKRNLIIEYIEAFESKAKTLEVGLGCCKKNEA